MRRPYGCHPSASERETATRLRAAGLCETCGARVRYPGERWCADCAPRPEDFEPVARPEVARTDA